MAPRSRPYAIEWDVEKPLSECVRNGWGLRKRVFPTTTTHHQTQGIARVFSMPVWRGWEVFKKHGPQLPLMGRTSGYQLSSAPSCTAHNKPAEVLACCRVLHNGTSILESTGHSPRAFLYACLYGGPFIPVLIQSGFLDQAILELELLSQRTQAHFPALTSGCVKLSFYVCIYIHLTDICFCLMFLAT